MYTEDLWNSWSAKESDNYKVIKGKKTYIKKGYLHFDHRFWFPERKDELKEILINKLKVKKSGTNRVEYWSFAPFLKILLKTPRYRYQEDYKEYGLETKIRPICFASHIDGLIFSFYAFCLSRVYEAYIKRNTFDEAVLAYRSDLDGKSNIQFSKEIFEYIRGKENVTAIALDIKGYFDHIDHVLLKEKWTKILGNKLPIDQYKLFKILTQYSYVRNDSILKRYAVNLKKLRKAKRTPKILLQLIPGKRDMDKFDQLRADKLLVTNNKPNKKTKRLVGIPQGSGMSALLSNIYLIDYDKAMVEKARQEGFLYRRYCDDILIVCESGSAIDLQRIAIEKIEQDCLQTIQEKKVEMTDFRRNSKNVIKAFDRKKMLKDEVKSIDAGNERPYYKSLQYLGFEFNGQDIFIRSSSLSRYYRKMKARIVKTVSMAYSPAAPNNKIFSEQLNDKIFKEQLFRKYTHLGKRNFLAYAYNASKEEYENSKGETREGLNSSAIKKQLRHHFDILMRTLSKKNTQRYLHKINKTEKLKSI